MLTVTPEKKTENYNFALPKEIADEFRSIGDVHGERNKIRWAVAAAAVLKLLEMSEAERDDLIQAVAGARHFPHKLRAMVETAKAKRSEKKPTHKNRMAPEAGGHTKGKLDTKTGKITREEFP